MITIPELHYGDILEITFKGGQVVVYQVSATPFTVELMALKTGASVGNAKSLEGLRNSLSGDVLGWDSLKHIPSNKAQITISELPEGNATVIVKEAPSK